MKVLSAVILSICVGFHEAASPTPHPTMSADDDPPVSSGGVLGIVIALLFITCIVGMYATKTFGYIPVKAIDVTSDDDPDAGRIGAPKRSSYPEPTDAAKNPMMNSADQL